MEVQKGRMGGIKGAGDLREKCTLRSSKGEYRHLTEQGICGAVDLNGSIREDAAGVAGHIGCLPAQSVLGLEFQVDDTKKIRWEEKRKTNPKFKY